jgi:hypothetical protein
MVSSALLTLLSAAVASAHVVISYPGWRGNNLVTNESFPFGMQWMYPCKCPSASIASRRETWQREGTDSGHRWRCEAHK